MDNPLKLDGIGMLDAIATSALVQQPALAPLIEVLDKHGITGTKAVALIIDLCDALSKMGDDLQ